MSMCTWRMRMHRWTAPPACALLPERPSRLLRVQVDALIGYCKGATLVLTAANDDARCKPGGSEERILRQRGQVRGQHMACAMHCDACREYPAYGSGSARCAVSSLGR